MAMIPFSYAALVRRRSEVKEERTQTLHVGCKTNRRTSSKAAGGDDSTLMARPLRCAAVLLLCLLRLTAALPSVALPFNAQVPAVARVGADYTFQFSASTFAPADANLTYSLSDQPAWLALDPTTRTFSGAPASADAGAATFTLTAADAEGRAQMPCTLVVSSDPAPQLNGGDVATQLLAGTANLSSLQPPIVTLLPLQPFRFAFARASFIDIVPRRRLRHYATLADHTPLPSWLGFDGAELAFEGVAPQLSAFPQSWDIELIASDVEGFAGATARFRVAIGRHQLVFVPQEQVVRVVAAEDVEFEGLRDAVFLNGVEVPAGVITSAIAKGIPEWLTLDAETLALRGTAPQDVEGSNFTVTATDAFGNEATAIVELRLSEDTVSSLFQGEIGTLTAKAGDDFEYHFPDSLFAEREVEIQVLLPATARWLKFDAETRTLSGRVPEETTATTVDATVTAESPSSSDLETQDFSIEVLPSTPVISTSSVSTPSASPVPRHTESPNMADSPDERSEHLSAGVIAGIVVGSTVAGLILLVLLVVCCRRWRRRSREGDLETDGPSRRTISRPILPPDHDAILMIRDIDTDVEKNAASMESEQDVEHQTQEPPPQIALDLPTQPTSRRMKWSKRFSRISQISSIGNGEDAIRADNNIPEWGRDSTALHTPHDSFSVPTEMARSSKQPSGDLSPSRRAFNRLRQDTQSQQSVGLGIDTGGAILLPRHSSRGVRSHRRARSSMGMSTVMDGSSVTSVSTRGTSMLSTRASDFPRPSNRSTIGSRSIIPGLTASEKRKSIRLVDRSDSVADNRSMQEKRQSFIRNRASTSFASPLFAHGSRTSSNPLQNGASSRDASSVGSQRRSRRGKSLLTTYSESSSLEPQARDHRRLSQRVRSTFAPSFPRAITRSSLGADDECSPTREGSSSGFETMTSSNSEAEWRAEMALPRHERSWVLPNEASPTPPPVPPMSCQLSSSRRSTPASRDSEARQKWKDRFREHSSSPLSTAVAVPVGADGSPAPPAVSKFTQQKRNRLSEPTSLVSSDSLSKSNADRPRLVHTNSKRPVSVEKVQRLSSLKAENDDARPGSEVWEAMESAGLMPPNSREGKDGTQRSNMSGPAFI